MAKKNEYSRWPYFEPTQRLEAKGGIKARSQRGAFGETWWGRSWMEALEGFDLESRIARGRSYARSGQVLSLDVKGGEVVAKVQGSRAKPYAVTVRITPLTEAQWERIVARLSDQPVYAARLLAGEMPAEFETMFGSEGISLFPKSTKDLVTDCSCPDWSNPCKHLAAVYCLLAEEFDRDPFLLFALRGKPREELLAALVAGDADGEEPAETGPALPPEPLGADPAGFWEGRGEMPALPAQRGLPPVGAPIVRRLGAFPFWRGDEPLPEALSPAYQAAAERALRIYEGEAA